MITRRRVLERSTGLVGAALLGGSVGVPSSAAAADDALFHVDFQDVSTGAWAPGDSSWGGLSLDVVTDEYFSVVEAADGRQVLDARFPEGVEGAGNTNGGGDFVVDLGEDYEELYCAYRVRFDDDFEFHQPGGKLPGLAGTNTDEERSITGGVEPDGENGWSARMMWRDPPTPAEGGEVMFYTYHPDMPDEYGENMYWDDGPDGQVYFQRGEWHLIEHRVVMNTPGEHDGILEGWFDGEKAFERTDLRFRDTADLAIDDFYFSLFFGGGQTEHWAHDREEHVQFDDLVVATDPIWLGDDEPPTAPTDLVAEQDGDFAVALAWTGAEDAGPSGVDHYRVEQDGRLRERVAAGTTETTVRPVVAGARHEFAVAAVDVAGNVSEPATVELETEPVDDEGAPPAPRVLEQVDRQLDWVELDLQPPDVPDGSDVTPYAHFELSVDGDLRRLVSIEERTLRVADLEPGESYEVAVTVVDATGDRSDPATLTVHTVPESPDDALVVNVFEDGLWPGENQLGEWAGAGDFENGDEGEVVSGDADDPFDGALRLEYDDAGWLRSRLEGEHDVSTYDQLTLLVGGDAGGEEHHCTLDLGEEERLLADVTDDEIGQERTAVRVPLDAIDVDDAPPYVYLSFGEGSAGAVTIDQIRFDHADARSEDSEEHACADVEGAEDGEELADGRVVCDLDGDGNFRDVDASGDVTSQDLSEFFANQHRDPLDSRAELFDFDGDGTVGQPDVVDLFQYL